MNRTLIAITLILFVAACHRAGEKAGEVLNKAGEAVGNGATQFVTGVGKGIHEVLQSNLDISATTAYGLQTGKVETAEDSAGHENLLSVYFIFNQDVNRQLLVRVVDKNGAEYGRARCQLSGKKGDAKYFDFHFDERTILESNSKYIFE